MDLKKITDKAQTLKVAGKKKIKRKKFQKDALRSKGEGANKQKRKKRTVERYGKGILIKINSF
jgi:hypothetical protein